VAIVAGTVVEAGAEVTGAEVTDRADLDIEAATATDRSGKGHIRAGEERIITVNDQVGTRDSLYEYYQYLLILPLLVQETV